MNRIAKIIFLCIVIPMFAAVSLMARPVAIKIGSPAPKGSPWDDALNKIAVEWRNITGGQVTVTVYPGGIAGDEGDMIRKLRTNNLQGAIFTSLGLNQLYKDTLVLSVPFLIRDDREFDYILDKVGPKLESDIEKAGFKVVAWTNVGWLHFLGKRPILRPDDLKRQRLASTDSDAAIDQAFKNLGFNTIALSNNEVMPGLSSGMVDACYAIPLAAAAYQWFGIANNMCDIPFAPVMGAIVLSERTWKRIPEKFRKELKASAEKAAKEMYTQTAKLEADAMRIMLANGLIVNKTTEADKTQWRQEFARGIDMIAGSTFSKEIYETINNALRDYRK